MSKSAAAALTSDLDVAFSIDQNCTCVRRTSQSQPARSGVSGRGQQALLDQPAKAQSSHIGAATTATDLKEQLTVLRFQISVQRGTGGNMTQKKERKKKQKIKKNPTK